VILAACLEECYGLVKSSICAEDARDHPVDIGEGNELFSLAKKSGSFSKLPQGAIVIPESLLNIATLKKNPPVELRADLRPRLPNGLEDGESLLEQALEL
jgi:hypothetical protein